MKILRNLLFALLVGAYPLPSQSPSSSGAAPEPRIVTYCDLAGDPAAFNHKLVRLTAFVTHGFEDFTLTEPSCTISSEHFSVWVMYGGKVESNTTYCCPGEGGAGTRAEPLMVEGVQIPLLTDKMFQEFTNLLKKERDTTVRVTVEGNFFAGEKKTINGKTFWGGAGHLGCCSLFVIQRVVWFEPHTRADVDYTSEAGWYEEEGCRNSSLRYVDHVSLSFPDAATERAIREQSLADNGTRDWAFKDPQRVALESLKPFYKDQVPVLRNLKKTRVRQVFRWKFGKKSIVVVVTRPYWLSLYSKSGDVAWVSTMIKETECD